MHRRFQALHRSKTVSGALRALVKAPPTGKIQSCTSLIRTMPLGSSLCPCHRKNQTMKKMGLSIYIAIPRPPTAPVHRAPAEYKPAGKPARRSRFRSNSRDAHNRFQRNFQSAEPNSAEVANVSKLFRSFRLTVTNEKLRSPPVSAMSVRENRDRTVHEPFAVIA